MLDDLYWVMSYSRWKDERYLAGLPAGAAAGNIPSLTEEGLRKAQEYNAKRYHYQGIGRYPPGGGLRARHRRSAGAGAAHSAGRLPAGSGRPAASMPAIYGFVANIYFYEIDTPLPAVAVAAHRSLDNVGQLAARCHGRVEDVPLERRSPDTPTGCDHVVTYALRLSTDRGGLGGMRC